MSVMNAKAILDTRLSAVVLVSLRSLYSDRTPDETDLAILREAIEEDGLILPLTVQKTERGYLVKGGVRRLAVLRQLQESDWLVPVQLIKDTKC